VDPTGDHFCGARFYAVQHPSAAAPNWSTGPREPLSAPGQIAFPAEWPSDAPLAPCQDLSGISSAGFQFWDHAECLGFYFQDQLLARQ